MKIAVFSAMIFFMVTGSAAISTAQDDKPPPPPPKGWHHPCRVDAERLCQGVRPGKGRIRACLKGHFEALSPRCKERFEDWKEEE